MGYAYSFQLSRPEQTGERLPADQYATCNTSCYNLGMCLAVGRQWSSNALTARLWLIHSYMSKCVNLTHRKCWWWRWIQWNCMDAYNFGRKFTTYLLFTEMNLKLSEKPTSDLLLVWWHRQVKLELDTGNSRLESPSNGRLHFSI